MRFRHTKGSDGKITIHDVPIFCQHSDKGFDCNAAWMEDAIANHKTFEAKGFRPSVVIGHNKPGMPEKETVGFFSNLYLKGKQLFADLVDIRTKFAADILDGAFPNRSVEVLPNSKRIVALALLGGTTPHFKLAQMFESSDEDPIQIYFSKGEFDLDEQEVQAAIEKGLATFGTQLGSELATIFEKLDEKLATMANSKQEVVLNEAQPQGLAGEDPQTGTPPHVDAAATTPQVAPTSVPTPGVAAVSRFVVPVIEGGDMDQDTMRPAGAESAEQADLAHEIIREDPAILYDEMLARDEQYEKRIKTLENVNYGMQLKSRRRDFESTLNKLRSEGRPIDIVKELEFAMSLSDTQVKSYFERLNAMPATIDITGNMNSDGQPGGMLGFGDNGSLQQRAEEVRADYAENRETYEKFGVSEDDVFYGQMLGGAK